MRRISPRSALPTLYLTFDDGPCPNSTERVLKLLKKHHAFATFFLVGDRAIQHPDIVRRICEQGHAVGNHSSDHGYRYYFSTEKKLKAWIEDAEMKLGSFLGGPTVGFRPPAGVCTPPLTRALKSMGMPYILWSVRYYDTRFKFTKKRVERSLGHLRDGDILLLHDSKRVQDLDCFMGALDHLLTRARHKGFEFAKLDRSLFGRSD